ncbi:class I SAM-dependent DNA methyltransferase [Phycisphaera mikurensis]|uniref:site-specific DNA-methyltransferase (adenine-specific) n=1 Tax=Phycisphaera mikurensis (strain NBRC 102666 / KCTC 22515 / FYK2301M01) TaxID=1142394 RepID=I0IF10_PHYMF|nr:DNA methyltransferase [Phycisphaera mikurensis]MBB6441641.1 hypothetical protein [Phycisphaera mikurensis]BAM03848.1 restriction endonuclease/modification methylase [Phycisphaera mikurensis NBRC 102666]
MPGTDAAATDFIARWAKSEGSERGNYQTFLSELCDLLGVPRPEPAVADDAENAYVFDRTVTSRDGKGGAAPGFIDLYKRDCFILEAKQGSETPAAKSDDDLADTALKPRKTRLGTARRGTAKWDQAMLAARGQAERYARSLPPEEGNPPLLITCDIGHTFELYSDFSRLGRTYTPFPDPSSHRIRFEQLADEKTRQLLATAWTDPLDLDPAKRSAKVTRDIAARLAKLSRSLEKTGQNAEVVAHFLMRVLFTLFAEDIDLIPKESFTSFLKRIEHKPELFAPLVESLWKEMNTGGVSAALEAPVLRFNGGLFAECHAIPLDADQLKLLIDAAEQDWSDVEPAIFGTLLERALDPRERHKLGAHYTPRAYVERLVLPTVIEPLRERWSNAQAAALTLDRLGKPKQARRAVDDFLHELCNTTVLDPACGSGNFLYVTLEHMKRLEAEVRQTLFDLGGQTPLELESAGITVDPHLLKGIELNPRAAAIADLVLWIGHLQWHHRTHRGTTPSEPILQAFANIENRDAVLAYDEKKLVTDEQGQPVTRWDGRTTKKHPVTGEDVPDETAREVTYTYVNPRKAEWPEADFVVGNPPFIGDKKMRAALGSGYVDALRATYSDYGNGLDFVLYWWLRCAEAVKAEKLRAFGLITTNSISQPFNRRIISTLVGPDHEIGYAFAISDHPWTDEAGAAAVRVAMTVVDRRTGDGVLSTTEAGEDLQQTTGSINAGLTIGVSKSSAVQLKANQGLACPGVQLSGMGFVVEEADLDQFPAATREALIRRYINGRDLMQVPTGRYVLDASGETDETLQDGHPEAYQWIVERVKPDRDQNTRKKYRREWWIFAEPRLKFRRALAGLPRWIGTCRTAKHRVFAFADESTLPDAKVVAIADQRASTLGILSSVIHTNFATWIGGWLGVGNDSTYNHADCLNRFPFPDKEKDQLDQVAAVAERLDTHRKRQQAAHPKLTLTNVYNVLEKLRSGEPLTAKEKLTHEQGLVSVLKQLHDDLDAAVFAAYGWSDLWNRHQRGDDIDEPLLERLVALNAERAAEEATGHVRWLRPDFQNPQGKEATTEQQTTLDLPDAPAPKKPSGKKLRWPDTLPAQTAILRDLLTASPTPLTPEALAASFPTAKTRLAQITEICETLTSLGLATKGDADLSGQVKFAA